VAFEVAEQFRLAHYRRCFHDEVEMVRHERHGKNRPAAMFGGFQELIEQLLGLP
jgi:hypothetical protein